jgi:hypothetical protein
LPAFWEVLRGSERVVGDTDDDGQTAHRPGKRNDDNSDNRIRFERPT